MSPADLTLSPRVHAGLPVNDVGRASGRRNWLGRLPSDRLADAARKPPREFGGDTRNSAPSSGILALNRTLNEQPKQSAKQESEGLPDERRVSSGLVVLDQVIHEPAEKGDQGYDRRNEDQPQDIGRRRTRIRKGSFHKGNLRPGIEGFAASATVALAAARVFMVAMHTSFD